MHETRLPRQSENCTSSLVAHICGKTHAPQVLHLEPFCVPNMCCGKPRFFIVFLSQIHASQSPSSPGNLSRKHSLALSQFGAVVVRLETSQASAQMIGYYRNSGLRGVVQFHNLWGSGKEEVGHIQDRRNRRSLVPHHRRELRLLHTTDISTKLQKTSPTIYMLHFILSRLRGFGLVLLILEDVLVQKLVPAHEI